MTSYDNMPFTQFYVVLHIQNFLKHYKVSIAYNLSRTIFLILNLLSSLSCCFQSTWRSVSLLFLPYCLLAPNAGNSLEHKFLQPPYHLQCPNRNYLNAFWALKSYGRLSFCQRIYQPIYVTSFYCQKIW